MSKFDYSEMMRSMKNDRILLVGGAGFIGHNLALELALHGISVMVADNMVVNNLPANVSNPELDPIRRQLYRNFLLDRYDMLRDSKIELRNVDARLFVDLARVFDEYQPTKVVHLSAISSAVEAKKDPGKAFDLQLTTLRNLLELCRTRADKGDQVETMFLSSSTVYGDFEKPEVDETDRPRPSGIYANAKYMGERLVRTYAAQHNVPCTIIRPSALYGERCVSRRVSQIFIENAHMEKPLILEGGGDGRLDFTYIKDLVNGMCRALSIEKHSTYTNTFNITYGNARTIKELSEVVEQVVPGVVLEDRPRHQDKPIRGTLSTARAQDVLGFKAEWSLEKGYLQYCKWYTEQWDRARRMLQM